MDLFLDPTLRGEKTSALFEQLRDAIVSGRLATGDRLPPSRDIATQLAFRETPSPPCTDDSQLKGT